MNQTGPRITLALLIYSSSRDTACGKFPLKLRGLTNKLTTQTSVHSLQKEAKPFTKHCEIARENNIPHGLHEFFKYCGTSGNYYL